MGVITTGNWGKALWPGINAWYGQEYNEYKTEYTDIFTTQKSSRNTEEDVGTSGLGLAVVKTEGDSVTYDSTSQGFVTRYQNVVRALGFVVTRETVEDDQYGVIAKAKAQSCAFSMRQTKEIVGANILNNAWSTAAADLGGDGSSLIASAAGGSASHPNFAGGTWTNGPTADVDLSEAALEQAVIDISKWTNDRGLTIAVKPDSLIIPVDLQFEAERILKSALRVGTADNDINALGRMGLFPGGVKVNHYLTDTDAWFIKTDVKNGFKLFQRRPMEFTMDNDFDSENAKYKATERYVFGWTDPRCVYGSQGA